MNSNRRSFLKTSATAGIAVAGSFSAFAGGATSLGRGLSTIDPSVAAILTSYGAAQSIEVEGKNARIRMDVNRFDTYVTSFEKMSHLSEGVRVENDDLTFQLGKTTYFIENRVS